MRTTWITVHLFLGSERERKPRVHNCTLHPRAPSVIVRCSLSFSMSSSRVSPFVVKAHHWIVSLPVVRTNGQMASVAASTANGHRLYRSGFYTSCSKHISIILPVRGKHIYKWTCTLFTFYSYFHSPSLFLHFPLRASNCRLWPIGSCPCHWPSTISSAMSIA